MTFEPTTHDAAGRIAHLTTPHGTITTPTLLPVINPNKTLITPHDMTTLFHTDILITNSYIIYKDPHLRQQALDHGLHHLLNFQGTIMTDSGTFQSHVYGDVHLEPLQIVDFQRHIGSDIGTILDIFSEPHHTHTQAQTDITETIRRASISIPHKGTMMLACPVQGGIYPDLRTHCAQELSNLHADLYPIGGVVPLMETQRYTDLTNVIIASKQGLDPSRPVHLFGAGHPLIFPLAVALGCDLFDSSAYAKYAADDRYLLPWGTEKLPDLTDLPCPCPICSTHTASELQAMTGDERVRALALHNLYVSYAELRTIRAAIAGGWLWELVEQRAASNPALADALRLLREPNAQRFLEMHEPRSKARAIRYTGTATIFRPLLQRFQDQLLTRYESPYTTTIVIPERGKPFAAYYPELVKVLSALAADVVVDSSFGPVPLALDEMFPCAQSLFPGIVDDETRHEASRRLQDFLGKKTVIAWSPGGRFPDALTGPALDLDTRRIRAVADMQFGRGAGAILFSGRLQLVKSKATLKIRNVLVDGEHVVSMRAADGMFTLKLAGARRLLSGFAAPLLRVTVNDDAVPFVRDGKSVFSKFVSGCDPGLRLGDECLIVDGQDALLGVGRLLLCPGEMGVFQVGVAVKMREGSGGEVDAS
jgi:7-cyano-7-deazaguanine tRNA-ribosyltransferase